MVKGAGWGSPIAIFYLGVIFEPSHVLFVALRGHPIDINGSFVTAMPGAGAAVVPSCR